MSEPTTRSFALFAREKLKSSVDAVNARRRKSLYIALGSGLGLFLVFFASVSLFFAPYRALMGEHGISYWPLLFLAPASLGLIGFSLVYILGLRQAVGEFRGSLVGRVAEFIDPSIVHEQGRAPSGGEMGCCLLSAIGGEPLPGTDRFRGRVPGAAVSFSDLRLKRGKPGAAGGRETLSGLYFHAVMERRFALPILVFPSSAEVGRSGIEAELRAAGEAVGAGLLRLDDPSRGRQILVPSGGEEFVMGLLSSPAFARLEELRGGGVDVYLSCRGDSLRAALLSPAGGPDAPGMFEEFDFARCDAFCHGARRCLELAAGIAGRDDLWKDGQAAAGR